MVFLSLKTGKRNIIIKKIKEEARKPVKQNKTQATTS
jgi:hypothetical protein